MRFQIIDAHGEVILEWDAAAIAAAAFPEGRFTARKRERFTADLARALDSLKRQLHSL